MFNTPDSSALIGEAPEVGRFLYATGFSGHGFKFCSVVGEILADLVLDDDTLHDIEFLRFSRFGAA